MRRLAVLGSTGSIGTATLDVAARFPDQFEIRAIAAGRRINEFAEQIRRFNPQVVSIEREEDITALERLLPGFRGLILSGREGLIAAATFPEVDTVVAGLVGAVGLASAHAAVTAGKRLALANKETMVVAGELMTHTARRTGAEIIPIDSEHNAIHQALRAGKNSEVRRLILTGSGGPFRQRPLDTFADITVEEALRHPTWKMGPKITIDSATMMNKGLEIIEAHYLFGLPPEQISVLLHPQSLVHSMVEFCDGSILAQMGKNDMRLPILYALSCPDRFESPWERLDLAGVKLEFEEPDPARYPAMDLAREALREGGAAPAVLNAANEIAVAAFLSGKIPFLSLVAIVAQTCTEFGPHPAPRSVDEAEEIDRRARQIAQGCAARLAGVVV